MANNGLASMEQPMLKTKIVPSTLHRTIGKFLSKKYEKKNKIILDIQKKTPLESVFLEKYFYIIYAGLFYGV